MSSYQWLLLIIPSLVAVSSAPPTRHYRRLIVVTPAPPTRHTGPSHSSYRRKPVSRGKPPRGRSPASTGMPGDRAPAAGLSGFVLSQRLVQERPDQPALCLVFHIKTPLPTDHTAPSVHRLWRRYAVPSVIPAPRSRHTGPSPSSFRPPRTRYSGLSHSLFRPLLLVTSAPRTRPGLSHSSFRPPTLVIPAEAGIQRTRP